MCHSHKAEEYTPLVPPDPCLPCLLAPHLQFHPKWKHCGPRRTFFVTQTPQHPLWEEICLCLLMIFDEAQATLVGANLDCLLVLHGTTVGTCLFIVWRFLSFEHPKAQTPHGTLPRGFDNPLTLHKCLSSNSSIPSLTLRAVTCVCQLMTFDEAQASLLGHLG